MAEIEKVAPKRIESVSQDGSDKYALLDNFPVTGFRSEEQNTLSDKLVALTSTKTSTETLMEEM